MINYTNVRSTQAEEPKELEILSNSVRIKSNIIPIHEAATDETPEFIGWQYDEKVYDKDEYIAYITTEQSRQITDTQIALCELYEMIGG